MSHFHAISFLRRRWIYNKLTPNPTPTTLIRWIFQCQIFILWKGNWSKNWYYVFLPNSKFIHLPRSTEMNMYLFLGVTNSQWYDHIRIRAQMHEIFLALLHSHIANNAYRQTHNKQDRWNWKIRKKMVKNSISFSQPNHYAFTHFITKFFEMYRMFSIPIQRPNSVVFRFPFF